MITQQGPCNHAHIDFDHAALWAHPRATAPALVERTVRSPQLGVVSWAAGDGEKSPAPPVESGLIVSVHLKIGNASLILLGIATVAVLVALLPITRIKWGEFEAQFDRTLDSVNKKVSAIEMEAEAKLPAVEQKKDMKQQEIQSRQKEAAEWNRRHGRYPTTFSR